MEELDTVYIFKQFLVRQEIHIEMLKFELMNEGKNNFPRDIQNWLQKLFTLKEHRFNGYDGLNRSTLTFPARANAQRNHK